MDSYQDITLNPDQEMPLNWLINSVYTKLHKALFELGSTAIGVSFPAYKVTLGHVIRLHGSQRDLRDLQQKNWLGGMIGYCNVADVLRVPDGANHRIISRKQSNMTQAKLNRLIKRGSIAEAEIRQYKARMFASGLDNPYLELQSSSNGHKHRRYIEFGPLRDTPLPGEFDQFGLSKTATVPWF
ncbi:type I-F CRISPR-associated endoribonuclease Cas6/Csy4 [Spongiibacter sp. KMU-166]|uniref:Type I-F CRISPR-associated endoribonuclease Cas6/Csy4 n=1 Tax=Spongiibacter thalassae TaxID=2721624 RepID=A0ABX1GJX3_9GAMM|nr:type I-F CRISPR-associated endoribonuclease Cas6/Csy4 [Spongiibacter thalassae]NKI19271.1 type I-F CRISPR-associated endoribonuclease Cas6/Csy4 [Spongiibacter thalassae]